MADRQSTALAAAIAETSDIPSVIAVLQGMALSSVLQIIVNEAGRRTRQRQGQARIVRELRPIVAAALDQLDAWFAVGQDAPSAS